MKHNKCSDMANCSCLLLEELISATCSWTASITKEMPSESPFNCLWLKKNFRLRQPVTKILRQIDETQFIGVFSQKNLKIAPLRHPSLSPISVLWVSNSSAAWCWCNLQTHQHWSKKGEGKPLQKVVVSIYFVTGCLNFQVNQISLTEGK